ncbi:STAS domain-containing protein [Actinoplanes sp. NEAU-A12]|uniref:STAS domain-containing protein n=1 Tax=Actinoplanes sandaracinus TaxID=3045177 RepID=A0ABT6WIP9_9ACTN|nr:STAS domain-containing protein [Actinoplanes sandaracinus]MDI6099592.1 STAS domain-containing protein [Actinoplanes sandaracinus]
MSEPVDGTVTAVLSGSFDMANAGDLETTLRTALTERRPRVLMLDAAAVDFCDCAGLRALLRVRYRAAEPDLTCRLVMSAVSPAMIWLLDLLGVGRLFGYPAVGSMPVAGPDPAGEPSG